MIPAPTTTSAAPTSPTTLKGYAGTLPDFLASSQAGSMEEFVAGPVSVDLNYDAKTQLVQSVMVPFLKLFGVEEGHGLSPFASRRSK